MPELLIIVSQLTEQVSKLHDIIKLLGKAPSENANEEVEVFDKIDKKEKEIDQSQIYTYEILKKGAKVSDFRDLKENNRSVKAAKPKSVPMNQDTKYSQRIEAYHQECSKGQLEYKGHENKKQKTGNDVRTNPN